MVNKLDQFISKVKSVKDLEIIFCSSDKYNKKKEISNVLLQTEPLAIAVCKNEEHVKIVYDALVELHIKFRVKSGGHNHEGYSSADDAVIIDVSDLKTLKIADLQCPIHLGRNRPINAIAKIGTGNRFGELYPKVQQQGYIISGGGCEHVAIGGFATGGGWGPYCRYLGMGYDNILGAEILLPDGTIHLIYDDKLRGTHFESVIATLGFKYDKKTVVESKQDLLTALRGCGGGNLGVILNWIYRVEKRDTAISSFTLSYVGVEDDHKLRELILKWIEFTRTADERITTYARVPVAVEGPDSVRFLMGGNFLGRPNELERLLEYSGVLTSKYNLTIEYKRNGDEVKTKNDGKIKFASAENNSLDLTNHQVYSSSMIEHMDGFYLNQLGESTEEKEDCKRPEAPKSTCDEPHPHKVSSIFPKSNRCDDLKSYLPLIDALIAHCKKTNHSKFVNKYFSLHGMGGATYYPTLENVYRYKDKDFIIQGQAWWSSDNDKEFNEENVKWVRDGIDALRSEGEGAFINFIDKSVKTDSAKSDTSKESILKVYYGKDKLEFLKNVKNKEDGDNKFDFELSIPK